MAPNIDDIAIFPLDVFLLPGETVRLHIFEDRYKQLIQDCEDGYLPGFGIMFKSPSNKGSFGSYVEVDEIIERYPEGEIDIMIKAVSIFYLQEFESRKEGKLYPGGRIISKPLFDHPASERLMYSWREYMIKHGRGDSELLLSERQSALRIATTLNLSETEKLGLVDMESHGDRESFIINYLRYLEFLYGQEESTFHGIYLN